MSAPERFHAPDQTERLLLDWARWMRRGVLTGGYLNSAVGCVGGGYSTSFEDMLEATQVRIDRTIDAIIHGLPPAQICALHHAYLNAVYRFRDFEPTLLQAKAQVGIEARRRGVLV